MTGCRGATLEREDAAPPVDGGSSGGVDGALERSSAAVDETVVENEYAFLLDAGDIGPGPHSDRQCGSSKNKVEPTSVDTFVSYSRHTIKGA